MDRIAIVLDGTSPPAVLTFVRGDTPESWPPPVGTHKVAEASLPAGWVMHTEPQPVPVEVTPWQIRTWLLQNRGVTPAAVSALLQTITDATAREQAAIDWDRGSVVRRSHPLIETLGAALGMDAAAIDQAFREAAELS